MTGNFLIPETITACAVCGQLSPREGYPCRRCGGLDVLVYVPADREAFERARAADLKMAATPTEAERQAARQREADALRERAEGRQR